MIALSPFNALLPAPAYAAAEVFTGNCKTVLPKEMTVWRNLAIRCCANDAYVKRMRLQVYMFTQG